VKVSASPVQWQVHRIQRCIDLPTGASGVCKTRFEGDHGFLQVTLCCLKDVTRLKCLARPCKPTKRPIPEHELHSTGRQKLTFASLLLLACKQGSYLIHHVKDLTHSLVKLFATIYFYPGLVSWVLRAFALEVLAHMLVYPIAW